MEISPSRPSSDGHQRGTPVVVQKGTAQEGARGSDQIHCPPCGPSLKAILTMDSCFSGAHSKSTPDLAIQTAGVVGPDYSKEKVQAFPSAILTWIFPPLEWPGPTGQMRPYGRALLELLEATPKSACIAHVSTSPEDFCVLVPNKIAEDLPEWQLISRPQKSVLLEKINSLDRRIYEVISCWSVSPL